jgi:hypothetical protein
VHREAPSLVDSHHFFFVGRCSVSVVRGCCFTYAGLTNLPSTALRRTMTVFFAMVGLLSVFTVSIFMKFRGPQALDNRPQKTMACPTANLDRFHQHPSH